MRAPSAKMLQVGFETGGCIEVQETALRPEYCTAPLPGVKTEQNSGVRISEIFAFSLFALFFIVSYIVAAGQK
jgi:hypothetical protein